MENLEPKLEPKIEQKYLDLANKLEELQAGKNNGMGVRCVRNIAAKLRVGNIDDARFICINEGDKIINYPDISEPIREGLFDGESYPYTKWYRNWLEKNKK